MGFILLSLHKCNCAALEEKSFQNSFILPYVIAACFSLLGVAMVKLCQFERDATKVTFCFNIVYKEQDVPIFTT